MCTINLINTKEFGFELKERRINKKKSSKFKNLNFSTRLENSNQ